jgi:hypothetical protein
VGTSEHLRSGVVRDADAVVHRFATAVQRPCARPGCSTSARATLSFRYAAQEAVLEVLLPEARPQTYDLCLDHAARTTPPRGWQLRDRRPEDERRPVDPSLPPPDLGGDRTVAVLAAALRAVPDAASERAVTDRTAEIGTAPLEVAAPGVATREQPVDADVPAAVALSLLPEPVAAAEEDHRSTAGDVPGAAPAPAPAPTAVPRPPLAVRDRGAPAADW